MTFLGRLFLMAICVIPALGGFGQVPLQEKIISTIIDPSVQDLRFYWKDEQGAVLGSIQRLKEYCTGKHKELVFAMNGGMYQADHAPLGLFIQDQRMLTPLNTRSGTGNFYMKPNGVLYDAAADCGDLCKVINAWVYIVPGQCEFEKGTSNEATE